MLATATVALALTAGTAPAAQADERPWRLTQTPWLWPESGLTQVAALGPSDVWAAGFEGLGCVQLPWRTSPTCTSNAIVRHWNGSSWESRNPPAVRDLQPRDLEASGPGHVWLSGELSNAAYLARWDGSRWSRIELPEACRSTSYLQLEPVGSELWVSNGCLAHWADGQWTAFQPQNVFLYRVYAVSATNAWGTGGMLSPYRQATMRWNGTSWSPADLPEGYDSVVAGGPQGVWLDGPGQANLLHGDGSGTGWTPVPRPPAPSIGYRVGDDGSLWSVTDPGKPGASVFRFDGTNWLRSPLPAQTGTGRHGRGGFDFTAVPGTGDGMWAVGTTTQGGPMSMTNS